MSPTPKRVLESLGTLAVVIPLAVSGLTILAVGLGIVYWLIGLGGIFQVLGTIVSTAEAGFKHDWKMAEVLLVLLVLFLVVRKR